MRYVMRLALLATVPWVMGCGEPAPNAPDDEWRLYRMYNYKVFVEGTPEFRNEVDLELVSRLNEATHDAAYESLSFSIAEPDRYSAPEPGIYIVRTDSPLAQFAPQEAQALIT